MATVVIAEAGPLIAFAGIDRLELFKRLFARLLIPQSVWDECRAKPGADTRRIEIAINEGWLQLKDTQSEPLSPSLGQGESDAIALAGKDPDNSLLILDDRLARRYALAAGLQLIGSVRVLHISQQRGWIESAEQELEAMAEKGFRVSLALLKQIQAEQEGSGD